LECTLVILPRGCVCEIKRLFERRDIEVEGRDGVPAQHVRVGREEVLNCRKCLEQLVVQLAQVVASLSLGCVGPEEKGKMLALLGDIAMQHEVGEQGLQAHAVEAGHLSVSVDQAEIAEQSDVKGWLHRDLLDSRFSNERTTRSFQPANAQRSRDQKEYPLKMFCILISLSQECSARRALFSVLTLRCPELVLHDVRNQDDLPTVEQPLFGKFLDNHSKPQI
jgi:hypothetical protein